MMDSKESEALLKAYAEAQGVASIFPVNEDENHRLYELAKYIWNKAKEFASH